MHVGCMGHTATTLHTLPHGRPLVMSMLSWEGRQIHDTIAHLVPILWIEFELADAHGAQGIIRLIPPILF